MSHITRGRKDNDAEDFKDMWGHYPWENEKGCETIPKQKKKKIKRNKKINKRV